MVYQKAIIACLCCLGFILACVPNAIGQQNPFEIRKRLKRDTPVIKPLTDTFDVDRLPLDTVDVADTMPSDETVTIEGDSIREPDTLVAEEDTVAIEELPITPEIPETETQRGERRFHLDLLDRIRDWQESYSGTIATRQSFLFAVVILFLVYLIILLGMNRSLPRKAIRAITNDNYLRFMQRDFNGYPTIYWLYYLFFFLNTGFFLFLIIQYFDWVSSITMFLLLMVILIISGIYALKHLVLFLLGSIFPVEMETGLFSFIIMLLNIILGFVLMPLNIMIAFAPLPVVNLGIWIGCISFILLYIYRQLKGMFISSRFISEYRFHFFLYLCAVEIAPLLIIYKVVSGQLGIQ